MNPKNNHALEQLGDPQFQQIAAHLQLVSLSPGEVLFGPGDRIDCAWFPVNGLIAVAHALEDGLSMDMALIGNDSMIGLRGLFQPICPYRIHVAHAGLAYRIPLALLRQHAGAGHWLPTLYMQASDQILAQIASEAACSRFHSVTQRVARWLLSRSERLGQPTLEATHLGMAESLGIRREAVTLALLKLPGIGHSRNRITLHDRSALESAACACHRSLGETLSGQRRLPFHARPVGS